jgi:SAM-dependent methyltransferase
MHAAMMADMPSGYDADAYWSTRLRDHWDLQGVGHREYPPSYNRWLYRRKHAVLARALRRRRVECAVDLGSGTGWVVRELRKAGAAQVVGCELTEVAVQRLRAAMPRETFHQVDIARAPIPVATGSADVVTMLDVAYHLVDDDGFRHAVGEVARVLRRDGVALVSDAFDRERHSPAEHVAFRGLPQWAAALEGTSLTVEALLPYFKTLSHPRDRTWRHSWHPAVRGPAEWAMDSVLPLRPWLRLAVLRRGG